jgi:hypothetical protein
MFRRQMETQTEYYFLAPSTGILPTPQLLSCESRRNRESYKRVKYTYLEVFGRIWEGLAYCGHGKMLITEIFASRKNIQDQIEVEIV